MFVQHSSLLLIHSPFFLRFSSYVTRGCSCMWSPIFFYFFRFLSLHSLVFPCKGGITITFHFCCDQSNRTDYWWREELVWNRFIKLHSATTFYYEFLLHVLFSQTKQEKKAASAEYLSELFATHHFKNVSYLEKIFWNWRFSFIFPEKMLIFHSFIFCYPNQGHWECWNPVVIKWQEGIQQAAVIKNKHK